MKRTRSPQEIDWAAAEWAARRENGLSPEEGEALDAWLAADSRHLGAYAKAEAVLAQLERVGAAGPDCLRDYFPEGQTMAVRRRTLMVGGGIAAGLAVAAGGAAWLVNLLGQERYSTRIGETKEAVLSDGSMVTLNTNSEILVRYSRSRREIVLVHGEALFDVAKNKKRPFVVLAGDTQVRAVGTSFTVCLLPREPVKILVREGVVEVRRPEVPEAPPVQLLPYTRAVAAEDTPIATEKVAPAQIVKGLSWRDGRLIFDNEPLAAAAREFARYSDIEIQVSPDLETQTVTGLYVSNDPVGFARAVAISLNLNLEVSNQAVRLSRQ